MLKHILCLVKKDQFNSNNSYLRKMSTRFYLSIISINPNTEHIQKMTDLDRILDLGKLKRTSQHFNFENLCSLTKSNLESSYHKLKSLLSYRHHNLMLSKYHKFLSIHFSNNSIMDTLEDINHYLMKKVNNILFNINNIFCHFLLLMNSLNIHLSRLCKIHYLSLHNILKDKLGDINRDSFVFCS